MPLAGQPTHAPSSVAHSQLITCLQSMARMSSTVQGLGWSALGVRLSTAASEPVGVGCGCHRGTLYSTCSRIMDRQFSALILSGSVSEHASS